jgi:hypothetical protein
VPLGIKYQNLKVSDSKCDLLTDEFEFQYNDDHTSSPQANMIVQSKPKSKNNTTTIDRIIREVVVDFLKGTQQHDKGKSPLVTDNVTALWTTLQEKW